MTFLALAAIAVLFGGQYVVFAAIGRRELRRRFEEALLAGQIEAEAWAEDLVRELEEEAA